MMLRRALIAAVPGLLAVGVPGLAQAAVAVVGQKAPDFTLTDTGGRAVKLSDYAGKLVVLEWTNPGCPFVRKHYGAANMQGLQKEATAKGVVWLTINSTEAGSSEYLAPAALARWMGEQHASPTATLLDSEGSVGHAYGARTTPHMYIIGPQGTLLYAGGIDSIPSTNRDDIQQATNYVRVGLNEALAGKPLSTSASRPYGCSIKYKS
jgi:peroxiredoxin